MNAHHPGRSAWTSYIVATFGARIAAACGDVATLRAMLKEMDENAASLRAQGSRPADSAVAPILAQLAWLEGDDDAAIAGWRAALEGEDEIDVYGQAPEVRVRLAAALAKRGELPGAASVLVPAIERAADDGGPRGALLAREALRDLAQAPWRERLPASHLATLREWAALVHREPPPAAEHETLTARELQVLERIAAGDSNKVIARALDLSLHTVKRHVANILGKLGADTRGQAAAWLLRKTVKPGTQSQFTP